MASAFIAEIGGAFASGDAILALLYGLAGAGAGVAVILYLRRWASRRARALSAEVASGRVVWAAQVTELLAAGRFGLRGRLDVRPDGNLALRPDAASTRRGAHPEVWGAGCARIAFTGSRRDITGMRYQLLELRRDDRNTRRFAAYDLTGALPPEAAAVSDA
jgi:hypothetical protein